MTSFASSTFQGFIAIAEDKAIDMLGDAQHKDIPRDIKGVRFFSGTDAAGDSFTLMQSTEGWIQQTRPAYVRPARCSPPPLRRVK